MTKYEINLERLKTDMAHINQFNNTPGNGVTRFSFSKEDREAREYLLDIFKELGLLVTIDGIGNIRAKYNPNNLDRTSIMVGSHIDTVPNGGEYDGLLGSISALEVVRTVKENEIEINRPIEIIIFSEEEGSNFGSGTLGSRVLTGHASYEDIKNLRTFDGENALTIIEKAGFDTNTIGEEKISSKEVYAMLEYHIEQGGVLEAEQIPLGIISSIVGLNTFQVTITGHANHAGTTPMKGRKDPLISASKLILEIENTAKETSDTAVSTVGKLSVSPGGTNVINNKVTFNVDIRDTDKDRILKMSKVLEENAIQICEENGTTVEIELLAETPPAKMSEEVITAFREAAKRRGTEYLDMPSGAGHDAMNMAHVVKTGMIFVPSKEGISHSKKEYTSPEEIEIGANILLDTVISLAR